MQPLGFPEWLLSYARRYRQSAALPSPPNARTESPTLLAGQPNVSKRQTEKKRFSYCDNFTIGRKKGNESNGEKEMENRKGRRNVGFSRGSLALLYTLEKGKTKKLYKLYTNPTFSPTLRRFSARCEMYSLKRKLYTNYTQTIH